MCPACGATNAEDARFCGSCGAAALAASCARCGRINPPDSGFCNECGAALATPTLQDTFSSPQVYTPLRLAEKILRSGLDRGRAQADHGAVRGRGRFTALAATLDPEETHAIMQRAFDLMLEAVHRYEGTVSQFLGDGILALFGAPIAHEDHAQRAVRAALAIQSALGDIGRSSTRARIDFRVRVGLNSGPVVVGTIGTDLNMTYTAIGDTVNLASRIQTLPPTGSVVISEATQRLVSGYFECRSWVRTTSRGGPSRSGSSRCCARAIALAGRRLPRARPESAGRATARARRPG